MKVEHAGADLLVTARTYRLVMPDGRGIAWLEDASGGRWAELRLLASLDSLEGPDETLAVDGPHVDEQTGNVVLRWDLASSRWDSRQLVVEASEDALAVTAEVEGSGHLTDVTLLAGPAVLTRSTGYLMSGAWFETLFCSAPSDPGRIVQPASESASIGVVSGSEPGRGNWFFTPGPFVFAAARPAVTDPLEVTAGPWLSFALEVAPGEATFGAFSWRAIDRGFGLGLDYEGKTTVEGRWQTPRVVIGFADDPYAAIANHRAALRAAGLATARPVPARSGPAWWREPIFCGWGAQGALARLEGLPLSAAAGYATQRHYDEFLATLEARGVIPGTIVVDDKWQLAYGTNEPDVERWPDMRGWIRDRHERGQRVLLWYRAWATEGIPAEVCVRNGRGDSIGIDPTHPDGEAAIRRSVRAIVGETLDADGLKIDFTGRTPSGVATTHHGGAWGVELLRRLLEIVADEARLAKSDALLVGHAPNPLVAPALDMLRLNDALRLDDPHPEVDIVPQMRYRAAVVRAACPEHLVDADDWCAPSLAGWRAYAAVKAQLGVPALYYATHIDRTGEPFEEADYDLLRRTWSDYRELEGLPQR